MAYPAAVLDHAVVLSAYDHARRTVAEAGFDLRASDTATCHFPRSGREGVVSYSRNACIDEVIAEFDKAGFEFEWKVYAHDEPLDLKDLLGVRGLEIGEAESLMIASARAVVDAPNEFRIERVKDAADYLKVANAVWNRPASWAERIEASGSELYVAYDGAKPVSCARATFPKGSRFAGLWSGCTLAEHRGRGLYRALVAARAQDAAKRGFDYLTVDALPTSQPILESVGFERVSTTWPCRWRATRPDPVP